MLQPGLMMDRPLLISDVIEHAAAQFGDVQVVSRETHGPLFRYSYAQCAARARKLANALKHMGLTAGSAVGSIAWNNHRHLEAYYAVSGSGMVIHTCNPRLHPQQLIYIINHAEDSVMLFDSTFAPLVKGIAQHCPKVKAWVCLSDAANMPTVEGVANVLCYEDLIAPHSEQFDWPQFDERTGAALCYTSGTTGNPKGALYSHRAIVLNAMAGCMPGVVSLSPKDTVLPVVPMFHINAWCIPYAAPIAGAKLVLPGPRLDGASLYELMETERVTVSAGVPTIWLALMQHVEQHGLRFSTMRRTAVGGSAMPAALIARFADEYDVEVRHGWGMTETTAVATMSSLAPKHMELSAAERHAVIAKQGKSVFGVEIKVVDDNGATLPRDGVSQGELLVRGQWIVTGYYKGETSPLVDGWFPTGDIATIDAQGVMQIRDRAKDVIKTGGEWISSIDLESAAIAHPAVAMAAVIGVKHPKWDERPLMFIVRKPGQALEREEILAFLTERVAKWWVPDDVIFLDALPVGGTGKVQKGDLRKQYGGVFS
ncbi:MAG: long-chain-fatty-acid--CoA ligase [Rhodoferax sp.]|uniref:long-chain-fatty-acid--CoA ligase n=1 Tax=Rhodoferax sp. TaxID=50421 RepID=UPI002727D54C|nr:long-chain-fatty-acid--CoA ligase [Rhodoferax sp.]MDO8451161.1 long-chain-fatty-acid--CoA ligase [Rhodoferax sp.]